MKINVGIREDGQEILFVTNDEGKNIGEIEVSKELYEVALQEWEEE